MAKRTMFLRDVISFYGINYVEDMFSSYKLEDYLFPDQLKTIEESGLWKKEDLTEEIISRYFMCEIGFETPALFEHYVRTEMKLLMREFAPLIYSTCIDYNPLINVDFTETFDRTVDGKAENKGKTKSDSNGKSLSHNINNDTPQGKVEIQKLKDGLYASSINTGENESSAGGETSAENNGKTNSLEHYTRNQKGNSGSLTTAQALILAYRKNIISVNSMIIDRLNKFFMIIY